MRIKLDHFITDKKARKRELTFLHVVFDSQNSLVDVVSLMYTSFFLFLHCEIHNLKNQKYPHPKAIFIFIY